MSFTLLFYLNYEGCKRILNKIERDTPKKFYLNYEGCKLSSSSLTLISFARFYLNYEGCKRYNDRQDLFNAVSFI